MNSKLRISLFGLAGLVAGFTLQGCFAKQPLPECNVTITSAGLGIGPYLVVLEPVSGTGACAQLDHAYAGMQRFRTAAQGGQFSLGVRTSLVADPWLGYTYSGNADPTNDCVNEEDCQGTDDPSAACVLPLEDGGVELYDGTPVTVDMGVGTVTLADGGTYEVDPANECTYVEEEIYRADPNDQNGDRITGIGQMSVFPTDGVCTVGDFDGGVQNYEAVPLFLEDGGTSELPAITHQAEWSNFRLFMSSKVQGTAFKADLKYTEGGCVANYRALGIWPAHECMTDDDCDPVANPDAGRVFGSGLNPEFKPVCNTTLGYCVPSVDPETIK